MRQAVLGCVLGAGLVAALAGSLIPGNSVLAEHGRGSPQTGEIVTFHWSLDGKHQQLVIIDPKQQAIAVYQVDGQGAIMLKGVRRFQHDLGLRGFNEVKPYAEEIRSVVQGGPPPGIPAGELHDGRHQR
jgi:hypothetical protein